MIKKVYLTKNQDDAKDEASSDFPNLTVITCIDLKFEEFCRLQQPSLFKGNKLLCFLNVDEYPVGDLLEVCDKVSRDVIWCFSSLAKNTKVYKKLKTLVSIEEVSGLEKQSDKKSYIKSTLNQYKLPLVLEDTLDITLPANKQIIKNEIQKISEMVALGFSIDTIKNISCSYTNDLDAILFVQALLNKNIRKSYILANKISDDSAALQLHALLTKKIKSLIFLCRGDTDEANKYWNTSPYYLNQEVALAKRLGYSYLFKLYEEVDYLLGNRFDDQPLFNRLLKLINFHIRDVLANTI